MKKEDYELKNEDYGLWNLRNEVTYNEATCLLLNLNPHKCFTYSNGESSVFTKDIPSDIKSRITVTRDLLEEARKRGELKETTPTGPYAWMAMPFTRKISISSLKAYAESIGQKPLFLFPEDGDKHSGQQQITPYFCQCPQVSKWEDITMTLIANDAVRIKTSHREQRYSYHELGMSDKRRGDQPTLLWELLKRFIKENGHISSQSKYHPKLPDTAKRLNRHLQDLFGIKENIYTGHYKREHGYKLRVKVRNSIYDADEEACNSSPYT